MRSKGTQPCSHSGGKCRLVTGIYRVNFARNLDGCSVTVSPSDFALSGWLFVTGGTTIEAAFRDPDGPGNIDTAFAMHVLC